MLLSTKRYLSFLPLSWSLYLLHNADGQRKDPQQSLQEKAKFAVLIQNYIVNSEEALSEL